MNVNLSAHVRSAACRVCGFDEVRVDQVQDGAARLELGECPRCEDRWTRPLAGLAPSQSLARSHTAARSPDRRAPCDALSHAA